MIELLKKSLYFYIASYFKFFAILRLNRWKPRIIVVTGSNGKTTLLHMLEAQFGSRAKVSHHANSAYGVPFDILDLHRRTLRTSEWVSLFLNAPRNVFRQLPKEKIYIVEADADRPHEGEFLAELLRPEVVLWVSTGRTHSMNFDSLVMPGVVEGASTLDVDLQSSERDSSTMVGMTGKYFKTVEEAIAFEYGYFLKYCKELAVIDGDSELEVAQTSHAKGDVIEVSKNDYLQRYKVTKEGTQFVIKGHTYTFKGLLPEEIYLSIVMCKEAVKHMGLEFDPSFAHFHLPPGRGSILHGKKNTVLIDSTYNANLASMKAMLLMFDMYPAEQKWVVLGDMKELGKEEQEEHEMLAYILNEMDLEQVILIGKAVEQYTLPLIHKKLPAIGFSKASDATEYLEEYLSGGEAILFKGSQSIYLEGLVERLVKNKEDVAKLPRQEQFWKDKRKALGFN